MARVRCPPQHCGRNRMKLVRGGWQGARRQRAELVWDRPTWILSISACSSSFCVRSISASESRSYPSTCPAPSYNIHVFLLQRNFRRRVRKGVKTSRSNSANSEAFRRTRRSANREAACRSLLEPFRLELHHMEVLLELALLVCKPRRLCCMCMCACVSAPPKPPLLSGGTIEL